MPPEEGDPLASWELLHRPLSMQPEKGPLGLSRVPPRGLSRHVLRWAADGHCARVCRGHQGHRGWQLPGLCGGNPAALVQMGCEAASQEPRTARAQNCRNRRAGGRRPDCEPGAGPALEAQRVIANALLWLRRVDLRLPGCPRGFEARPVPAPRSAACVTAAMPKRNRQGEPLSRSHLHSLWVK